ncbi:hypothetical protein ACL598_17020 [Bordetella bronchialis]|uniref:hypothetical protein n=1 Tax=Bordetella bronchialis TaxID=463025 RepID=UPI003D071DB8
MAKHTFKPGDLVYNISGMAAQYMGAYPDGGHVVIPEFEYEDREPHYGEPVCWMEVFATPPREKLAGDLDDLHAKIRDAKGQLAALRDEVRDAERTKEVIAREAAKSPDLEPLALWLEGRAKFATILGADYESPFSPSYTTTGPVPEIFKDKENYGRLRLVALFYDGETERTHSVRVMRYSDGSGNDRGRRLFLGETAAESLEKAAAHVADQQKKHWNDHNYPQIGLWLEHFGFSHLITDKVRALMLEYQKKVQANQAKAARERLERAEREAAEARAALEKAGE